MPEIWLNYGKTDIVLDIRAENLDQQVESQGTVLSDSEFAEKLDSIDVTKSMELVVLNNSKSVQKTILALFEKCEQKAVAKPQIFADKTIMNFVKLYLPEGSSISEFDNSSDIANPSCNFIVPSKISVGNITLLSNSSRVSEVLIESYRYRYIEPLILIVILSMNARFSER